MPEADFLLLDVFLSPFSFFYITSFPGGVADDGNPPLYFNHSCHPTKISGRLPQNCIHSNLYYNCMRMQFLAMTYLFILYVRKCGMTYYYIAATLHLPAQPRQ